MKSCLVVAVIVVVVFAQAAGAQVLRPPSATPALQPPPPGWQQRSARFDQPVPGEVDVGFAVGAPVILTLLSWGVIGVSAGSESGGGVLLGTLGALTLPSVGKWYVGEAGGIGLATRGAGAALLIATLFRAERYQDSCDESCGTPSDVEARLWLGLGLIAAGTIYDLATSGSAARAHNARLRKMMVMPTAQPGGAGLSLVGRF